MAFDGNKSTSETPLSDSTDSLHRHGLSILMVILVLSVMCTIAAVSVCIISHHSDYAAEKSHMVCISLLTALGVLLGVSLSLLCWIFYCFRKHQKMRLELLDRLAEKNQELQNIVYVASHDLKTPLVNISGFSGMLTDYCADLRKTLETVDVDDDTRQKIAVLLEEDIQEAQKFIQAGVQQIHGLLDGLLKISRVGTVEITPQRLDMNLLMSDLVGLMRFQIEKKQAQVTVETLPPCDCDPDQIKQVFTNLIDNALKYLSDDRPGKIRISGRVQAGTVIYCVEDNGIGIETRFLPKIFEIYYRLNTNDAVEGEGLGLSIVRRILDRYNGAIRVESEPGVGSRFFVSLPYQELEK